MMQRGHERPDARGQAEGILQSALVGVKYQKLCTFAVLVNGSFVTEGGRRNIKPVILV
jgi:hypothetical protein